MRWRALRWPTLSSHSAGDRAVHQRVAPQRPRDRRRRVRRLQDRLTGNMRQRRPRQRLYTVVRRREQAVVQVDQIAAQVHRQYLPRAVAGDFAAEHETGKDEDTAVDFVAIADEVRAHFAVGQRTWQIQQNVRFGRCEQRPPRQLVDHRGEHGDVGCRHGSSVLVGRGESQAAMSAPLNWSTMSCLSHSLAASHTTYISERAAWGVHRSTRSTPGASTIRKNEDTFEMQVHRFR